MRTNIEQSQKKILKFSFVIVLLLFYICFVEERRLRKGREFKVRLLMGSIQFSGKFTSKISKWKWCFLSFEKLYPFIDLFFMNLIQKKGFTLLCFFSSLFSKNVECSCVIEIQITNSLLPEYFHSFFFILFIWRFRISFFLTSFTLLWFFWFFFIFFAL